MDRDLTPELRPNDPPLCREIEPDRPERQRDRARLERYSITDRQQEMIFDIGRFRTVAAEDLMHHRYSGNRGALREDLRSLLAQGLVQRRTALVAKGRHKLVVLVLTKPGRKAAEAGRVNTEQAVYSGFVKPGEVAHDAAIYRMFHKEAAHIAGQGGTIRRVVLDYELKKKVYSPLAKSCSLPALQYARRQAEVACENGLKVVHGKIPLPDLPIEYETAEGDVARVDLELATHHYHGSHLRTKAEAGFKIYGDAGATNRSPVFEEPEITASILSL